MEYIYAVLLLHTGKKEITEESLAMVLDSVDVSVDEPRLKALVATLDGVDIDEAMANPAINPVVEPIAIEPEPEPEPEPDKEDEDLSGLAKLFG
jgi:large subunit ribosomal protein L12